VEVINLHRARSQLSKLVERALQGDEITIGRAGKPLVRLVPVHQSKKPRRGGQWKGKVRVARDFDQLPDDIARALGIEKE
jgi:prevent-host-death family protein